MIHVLYTHTHTCIMCVCVSVCVCVYRYDLTRALTRKMAFEAVMRVRASRGVRVAAFHGKHSQKYSNVHTSIDFSLY